uniref:Putative secreted protein n=1 Tax=Anopheles triannulatus TaxID=58253 RepID=A0A2M4B7U5_9DIPT
MWRCRLLASTRPTGWCVPLGSSATTTHCLIHTKFKQRRLGERILDIVVGGPFVKHGKDSLVIVLERRIEDVTVFSTYRPNVH